MKIKGRMLAGILAVGLLLSGCTMHKDDASPEKRILYLLADDSLLALVWTEQYVLLLSPESTVCLAPNWFMK